MQDDDQATQDEAKQEEMWEEYLEQQRRLSCEGCGRGETKGSFVSCSGCARRRMLTGRALAPSVNHKEIIHNLANH